MLLNAILDESEMYQVGLQSCGFRVTIARDVASARRILRREAVDVLVIDSLYETHYRRAEFVRRWSRLAHRDRLPILVLSGYLTDAPWATPSAAEVCLLKPCPPNELTSSIARLLEMSPDCPIREMRENT